MVGARFVNFMGCPAGLVVVPSEKGRQGVGLTVYLDRARSRNVGPQDRTCGVTCEEVMGVWDGERLDPDFAKLVAKARNDCIFVRGEDGVNEFRLFKKGDEIPDFARKRLGVQNPPAMFPENVILQDTRKLGEKNEPSREIVLYTPAGKITTIR